MNTFQDSVTKLKTLYSFSKRISILGAAKQARVHRTIILEKMLEKILLHDHSILTLLSVISDQIRELDVSLIASAARNIMETTNIYFHISQRKISKDDIEFRAATMMLNAIYNEIEITKKFGFSQNCFHAQINHSYFGEAIEQFQKFPQFLQLSKDEQAQVLSGRKPTFQMKSPCILQKEIESAIYNLLSNSVHGLPIGLGNNSVNHSYYYNNFFHVDHLLFISLQVSRIYTAHVVKDYLNLRKRLYSLLNPEEKKQLKYYMSTTDLDNYIYMLREKYERDFLTFN